MLAVDGIDVYYGDVRTLWEVTLQVRSGEMVALVGGNGAGKTTTLRTVSGLLRPRRGVVSFDGRPTAGLSAHAIADLGVGHVPEGRQLFPLMTVEENLLLGAYLPRARPRRPQNLEMVYAQFPILKERAGQDAGTLSGGEQQMLAIGRALMSEPRLLILDEPSLGLAPLVVNDVFSAIERVRRRGITVLLVEQNVSKALAIADRAYVLENGRVVLQGTGAELLTRPDIKRAYLGV